MAHKESDVLPLTEKYKLDKYEFSIETRSIPQTQLMDVIAKATGPAGKLGAKTIQVPQGTNIEGWHVEANSKTADVYLEISAGSIEYNTHPGDFITHLVNGTFDRTYTRIGTGGSYALSVYFTSTGDSGPVVISDTPEGVWYHCEDTKMPSFTTDLKSATSFEYEGTTLYYQSRWGIQTVNGEPYYDIQAVLDDIVPKIFDKGTPEEKLVGRFAIDIRVAGGTAGNGGAEPGPDGQPWQDVDDGQPTLWPGDEGYPDPEDPDYPGDDEPYYPPSKTLYLDVEGALSGRHNDPLHDTSYSYVPADKATVKPYGYGGDGGHGGGGGGGASTIIVNKFATDKADYKEITVKPKRHGYGSGGGKGGKGGDGCILIYY